MKMKLNQNIVNLSKFMTLLISIVMFSCSEQPIDNKLTNNTLNYFDTILDEHYRKQGTIVNGKREGLVNTYFNNEIIETELFKSNTIDSRIGYYKGSLIILKKYHNEKLSYSYIEDYKMYLKYLKLEQTPYDIGEPNIIDGRNIYKQHCYNCHNNSIGKEFYSKNSYSDININTLYKNTKLDSINGKIKLYPADTNNHYIFGFLSQNDLEALQKFFKSDNDVNVYVN